MADDMKYTANDSLNRKDEPVVAEMVPGRAARGIGTDSDYRSLTKSILLIGIIVPLVPMVLASAIIYYWFHVSFKEEIQGHLLKTVGKGRANIDDFMDRNPNDVDYRALNQAIARVGIAEAGHVFITDRDGLYQAGQVPDLRPGERAVGELLRTVEIPRDEVTIVQGTDDSGHERIFGIARLQNNDWVLIYQQRISDLFSRLHRAKWVAIAVVVIVCLLIGINALRLSKMMVRRIAQADREKQKRNEQMYQTGKLASIGELAAGVAHEINNPVAIMVEEAGWIDDLLKEEEFRESGNLHEFRRALEQIRSQGKRCREITHKLLSFARKTESRVQDIQIGQLIQDTITILEKRVKDNGIIIHSDIQAGLPAVKGSSSELQQVLVNLINNAIDATEEGEMISVSAQLQNNHVAVCVSDSGSGIEKDDLSRIFDPFFTTKPLGKGTGLGLAICYGIVRELGGRIDVSSEIGQGSTFRIRIPRAMERQDDGGDLNQAPEPANGFQTDR